MEITASKIKGWDILAIEGEFVVKYLVNLRKRIEKFEKKKNPRIALDLSQTSYLDSSALSFILNHYKIISSLKGDMVLFGANEDTRSLFSIVGLDSMMSTYDSFSQFEDAI